MALTDDAERRRAHRYEVAITAEVVSGGRLLEGTTRNLSETGVNVVLPEALEEAAVVHLSLFLTQDGVEDPQMEPFESPSTVMWCADSEPGQWTCGMRFGSLSPAQRSLFALFVSSLPQGT